MTESAQKRPNADAGLEDDCHLGGAALYAKPDLAIDARRELEAVDDGLPGLQGLAVALDGLLPDVGVVERLGDELADREGFAAVWTPSWVSTSSKSPDLLDDFKAHTVVHMLRTNRVAETMRDQPGKRVVLDRDRCGELLVEINPLRKA